MPEEVFALDVLVGFSIEALVVDELHGISALMVGKLSLKGENGSVSGLAS